MTACRVLGLSLYTRTRKGLVADTVQIVLPGKSYCGVRTKYASAEIVAVFATMPSRFQPISNWSRSITALAVTRSAPSPAVLTWTGSGTGAVTSLIVNVAWRLAAVAGAGFDAGHLNDDLRIAVGVEEVGRP